jgi:phage portal protein BeeE
MSNGMKYEPLSVNAVDAQLIQQLEWTATTICATYQVPAHLIGVGPPPPFANVEALQQQYLSQCLHAVIVAVENALDEGLGLAGTNLGTEFDIDDLIYLDTATRTAAAQSAIGSGAMSPNEVRRKYFGLGPVKGGDTPYLQQQNYSLSALDDRDKTNPLVAPDPPPAPSPALAPPGPPPGDEPPADDQPVDEVKRASWSRLAVALLRKDWTGISDGL